MIYSAETLQPITKDSLPEQENVFLYIELELGENGEILFSVGETWHITKIKDYLSLLEQ